MWLFILTFNLAAAAVVVPRLSRPSERTRDLVCLREEARVEEIARHDDAAAESARLREARRRDREEQARASSIYLSWLTKRDALRA